MKQVHFGINALDARWGRTESQALGIAQLAQLDAPCAVA